MEPVLFDHAASIDGLRILNRTAFEDFSEGNDGIVATVRNVDPGTTLQIHADFIVGCDGARSLVRKAMTATCRERRSSSACNRPISTRPDCSP